MPGQLPPKNPWPQVVLALGLAAILGTCAVLSMWLGKSEAVVLTLAALIAGPALAWFATSTNQKLDQVKELSNGSMDRRDTQLEQTIQRQMEMNERLLSLVAQTHPNIPADVAAQLMPALSLSPNAPVSPTRVTPAWEEANLK